MRKTMRRVATLFPFAGEGGKVRKLLPVSMLVVALVIFAAVSLAGSGTPVDVHASYNAATSTLTVSGHYNCNDVGDQGGAVFQLSNTPAAASPIDSLQQAAYGHTDNQYDIFTNCTSKSSQPFSLVYTNFPRPGAAQFCLVVYHRKAINNPSGVSGDNLRADGTYVNTDNSWHNNNDSYGAGTCESVPPALRLRKTVTKDDGGTAVAADWTLTASGAGGSPTNLSGATPVDSDASFKADTYTLAETGGPPDYTPSGWSCVMTGSETPVTVAGGQVVVAPGQDVTCTITNDDIAPKLTLKKTVNGGTSVVGDWTLTATGADVPTLSGKTGDASVTAANARANKQYTLSESGPAGYTASAWVCTGAGSTFVGPDKVTLAAGANVTCTITNTRKVPSITVEKTVSSESGGDYGLTASKPENGGTFYFKVKITNTSDADTITVSSLTDIIADNPAAVNDLVCAGATEQHPDGLPFDLAHGLEKVCTFTRDLIGNAGDNETDHVDISWKDGEGTDGGPTSSNTANIALADVPSILQITKSPSPSALKEPGGNVTFKIVITNPLTFQQGDETVTTADSITLNDLTDTKFGDLTTECGIADVVLAPGQSKTCQVTRNVTGTHGSPHQNSATVTGADDDNKGGCSEQSEGSCKSASASATVTFTQESPPTPQPTIDVAAQKTATPQVTLPSDGSGATITYAIAVVNNGPDTATNVFASDPAPSGVKFLMVTQPPSQGSCVVAPDGSVVSCANLGTLFKGQSVTFTVTAKVTVTGTITNEVTTGGSGGPDTNPSNNVAKAQTLVVAAVKPPKPPAPKPKPLPEICNTITVTPKMLKGSGKAQKISIKVTQGKKGVAGATVKITGPDISKTVKSGKNGKVSVTVKPTQPGIIRAEIQNKKACNTQRIGVVGVFEPPVTG